MVLNRVLWADLKRMWQQALAISILLACGIATFVMSTSAMNSLQISRERYYRDYRFSHVFALLTRAPQSLAVRLSDIEGIEQLQTRIVRRVLLDMPLMIEPASCRLISIEGDPNQGLNRLCLRRGRFPNLNTRNEAIASEPFAEAHDIQPGDELMVNMDGRKEKLTIVGIGLSPEFVYAVQPGLLLTDNRRYGILWMPRRSMEAAFNMEGAFNNLNASLYPDASIAHVLHQVDRILKPFGGAGAYTRRDQESDRRLSDEMHQMRSMAYVTPFIFLSVSAFLFNIVLTRMVHQQKEQIASLRAFGFTRYELAFHYFKLMAILVACGTTLGWLVGWRLSIWMTDLYLMFFRFPVVIHSFAYREAATAALIGFLSACMGSFGALRQVVRLEPAVAMRPEPPQTLGSDWLDRTGLGQLISPIGKMILRRLEGNALATSLSILGIAMGVAVMVLGTFMEDTIAFVMDVQFGRSQRQDVMLTFNEPKSANGFYDASHLPGVTRVETFRAVAVRLRHGPNHYRLSLMGLSERPELYRILDENQKPIDFPQGSGLTLTKKLCELLDVKLHDKIMIEVLESDRKPQTLAVTSVFSNYTDPAAFLNRMDLHKLMQESERPSGAFVSVDSRNLDALYEAVKETPAIAGVLDNNAARKNFKDLIQANTRIMRIMNSVFGVIIAIGVIYNAALIALAESSRDLATLRVIGFSRREVSTILIGEIAVITLLAIPIGLPIGYGFCYLATLAIDTDTHRFPLVVSRHTFAYATLVILMAAMASTLIVRRMLSRLDLVSVLKVKIS
jgi:putative ABC transport system permease protein